MIKSVLFYFHVLIFIGGCFFTQQVYAQFIPGLEGVDSVGSPLFILDDGSPGIHSIDASPDGRLVATGGSQGVPDSPFGDEMPRVTIWNTQNGEKVIELTSNDVPFGAYGSVEFSEDGKFLLGAALGGSGGVVIWETDEYEQVGFYELIASPATFSNDAETLFGMDYRTSESISNVIQLQRNSGEIESEFEIPGGAVGDIEISGDGLFLAIDNLGGDDEDTSLRIWNILDNEEIYKFESNFGIVEDVEFSLTEETIFVGGVFILNEINFINNTIIRTFSTEIPFPGLLSNVGVFTVSYDPEFNVLIGGSVLWDIESQLPLASFETSSLPPHRSAIISSKGMVVFSYAGNGPAEIWDYSSFVDDPDEDENAKIIKHDLIEGDFGEIIYGLGSLYQFDFDSDLNKLISIGGSGAFIWDMEDESIQRISAKYEYEGREFGDIFKDMSYSAISKELLLVPYWENENAFIVNMDDVSNKRYFPGGAHYLELEFSEDGTVIYGLFYGDDFFERFLGVWDSESLDLINSIRYLDNYNSPVHTGIENLVAFTEYDEVAKHWVLSRWDYNNNTIESTDLPEGFFPNAYHFVSSSEIIFFDEFEQELRVWDLVNEDNNLIYSINLGFVEEIEFDESKNMVLVVGYEYFLNKGYAMLFNLNTLAIKYHESDVDIHNPIIADDEYGFYDQNGIIHIFDLVTQSKEYGIEGHRGSRPANVRNFPREFYHRSDDNLFGYLNASHYEFRSTGTGELIHSTSVIPYDVLFSYVGIQDKYIVVLDRGEDTVCVYDLEDEVLLACYARNGVIDIYSHGPDKQIVLLVDLRSNLIWLDTSDMFVLNIKNMDDIGLTDSDEFEIFPSENDVEVYAWIKDQSDRIYTINSSSEIDNSYIDINPHIIREVVLSTQEEIYFTTYLEDLNSWESPVYVYNKTNNSISRFMEPSDLGNVLSLNIKDNVLIIHYQFGGLEVRTLSTHEVLMSASLPLDIRDSWYQEEQKYLFASSWDGTLRRWDINNDTGIYDWELF